MSNKKLVLIIIGSALLAWIFVIFPGRYWEAKISTWPILNKWKILSPQAPIVITNRETIRVSDSGDAMQAAQDAKSKLSTVVFNNGQTLSTLGGAVNLTSDGVFVTVKEIFEGKNLANCYVVLNDGSTAHIAEKVEDPATGLVVFSAQVKNPPVISLASSKNLAVGEKVLLANNSLTPFNIQAQISYISKAQADISGQVIKSDFPVRTFEITDLSKANLGQVVLSTSGELAGVIAKDRIISSDVIKQILVLYYNNSQKIVRNSFGFSYVLVNKSEATILNSYPGLTVAAVDTGSAAQKSGLLPGDVIIYFDDEDMTSKNLEEVMQVGKPGQTVNVTVMRKGEKVSLKLTVGELK